MEENVTEGPGPKQLPGSAPGLLSTNLERSEGRLRSDQGERAFGGAANLYTNSHTNGKRIQSFIFQVNRLCAAFPSDPE